MLAPIAWRDGRVRAIGAYAMTEIIIPLSKLVESEDNVRRTDRRGGVSQLAASIEAIGLLQSLVVREAGERKYAVIAGGRRLRALRLLAKAGSIAKNEPIPCRIVSTAAAAEMSLAENVVRCQLLPADEIVATAALAAVAGWRR
jgi:ParB family transcriptional regulator, chromosome partitioning protein